MNSTRAVRTIHLIDVENLLGGHVTVAELADLWPEYFLSAGVVQGDHLLVASARRYSRQTWFNAPKGCRLLFAGNEKDAAEQALLAGIDVESMMRRYQRVAVGSGDGAFVPLVEELSRGGMSSDVVAGRGFVAKKLRLAARQTMRLPAPFRPVVVAA